MLNIVVILYIYCRDVFYTVQDDGSRANEWILLVQWQEITPKDSVLDVCADEVNDWERRQTSYRKRIERKYRFCYSAYPHCTRPSCGKGAPSSLRT